MGKKENNIELWNGTIQIIAFLNDTKENYRFL